MKSWKSIYDRYLQGGEVRHRLECWSPFDHLGTNLATQLDEDSAPASEITQLIVAASYSSWTSLLAAETSDAVVYPLATVRRFGWGRFVKCV